MARKRRRTMHYSVQTFCDGTVIAAYPIRKPHPKVLKRDGMRIDGDGIARDFPGNWQALGDSRYENRFRFQDIIATNLNTRRAIRELVCGPLESLRTEVASLRAEVAKLHDALGRRAI